MEVVIIDEAENDLSALRHWIAEDSPKRADSFLDELETQITGLAEWPERFPVAYGSRRGEVRRLVYRGYRILYLVFPDRVEIMHVHHGSRAAPSDL